MDPHYWSWSSIHSYCGLSYSFYTVVTCPYVTAGWCLLHIPPMINEDDVDHFLSIDSGWCHQLSNPKPSFADSSGVSIYYIIFRWSQEILENCESHVINLSCIGSLVIFELPSWKRNAIKEGGLECLLTCGRASCHVESPCQIRAEGSNGRFAVCSFALDKCCANVGVVVGTQRFFQRFWETHKQRRTQIKH